MSAVTAGDHEAYRAVVQICEARVRLVLAAILPDPDTVEDLAQEVFVTAFSKLAQYQPGSDFPAWLKAIARGLALNERRRWFRRARFQDRFEADFEALLEPGIEALSERFEGDVLAALRECIAKLEEPARTLTEDFYFRDCPGPEIARRRGRSEGWVRLALFRARSALATCLQTKGVA